MTEREQLAAGLRALGGSGGERLAHDEAALDRVLQHLRLVAEWNQRVNLTAITEPAEMVIKHAVDSATCLEWLPEGPAVRLVDVGSGAGFPGLILKCLRPELRLTLVDSSQKRCNFLEQACARLGWGKDDGVEVVWGRAEELGRQAGRRASHDVVVARAVAPLPVLCELCLPLARVGGAFIAMKGPGVHAEMVQASKALEILGGTIRAVRSLELPGGAGERVLVEIGKGRETPAAYPRRNGVPQKTPLGQ